MDTFKPNPQRRADMSSLRAFLETLPDGARISPLEVEQATGVRMDRRGQALVAIILKRLGREYLSLRGYGWELSSPENALDIVGSKVRRIDSAIDRASKASGRVAVRHVNQMSQERRNHLLHMNALLSTLRVISEEGPKKLKE